MTTPSNPNPTTTAARVWYVQARAILQVVLDGYGADTDDSDTLVIPVLPKSCTVHINSYKQADSYELVFDARDLPIDPRLIRAGAAEIYIFQTTGVTDGLTTLSRSDPLSDADPANLRPRSALDTALMQAGATVAASKFTLSAPPRIAGLFDEDDLELSESGKWVTISGQDYTAYLASLQWKPNPDGSARRVPTGQRLDAFVTTLVGDADPTGALSVVVQGVDASTLPVVGAAETRSTTRGIPVEQNTTYWDVIYKVCERYGFIAFVSGLNVVISQPKVLADANAPSIKQLTFGKNLSHLSLKRKLGKEQVPTQIVKCYDPDTLQTITGQYPLGDAIDTSVVFSNKTNRKGNAVAHANIKASTHIPAKSGKIKTTIRERDDYQITEVYGINDKRILNAMALNRYQLLAKGERTVTAKTRDPKVEDGTGTLQDILSVATGDAFAVKWQDFNQELLTNPDVSQQRKSQYLQNLGFNSQIADQIAAHYEVLEGIDRPLRFKEGTITYDCDSGVEIEMELQDFIVIDGVRPSTPGNPTRSSSMDANHASLVDGSGTPIGGAAAQRLGGA